MIELQNLEELRNYQLTDGLYNGLTVYIKGHTNPGDGGSGVFMWRTEFDFTLGKYSNENNGTIVKSTIYENESGSWVRQYDGFINVSYFGALGNLDLDYTEHFMNAIEFAKLNSDDYSSLKSSTVFIPNGTYHISKIDLKSGVNILGESIQRTVIITENDDINNYLFEIEEGQVYINISNLNIIRKGEIKNTIFHKGCFLFEAKHVNGDKNTDGGLWYSTIKNIKITGFYGNGIYLKGGESLFSTLLPNQFNVFENIRITKENDVEFNYYSNALRMTGENGQHTFINCQFDGVKRIDSYDVIDDKVIPVYSFDKWYVVSIENSENMSIFSYVTSHVITFLNCTFQNSNYGIIIHYAENITIDNCWFEDLGVAITVNGDPRKEISKSINILNNRFTNAAGFGSNLVTPKEGYIKNGQCVFVDFSVVNIFNNYVTASFPELIDPSSAFVLGMPHNNGINLSANTFRNDNSLLSRTYGVMQFIDIESDNSIICKSNKLVFVNCSISNCVKKITSTVNTGEMLTIRAWGNVGNVTLFNGQNIFLGNLVSLLLNHGDTVTLIKVDYGPDDENFTSQYQLVSYIQTTTP
jgi:parallel beta-helix repeat protein